ncbi:MAG: hypothetical protein RLZZ230_430 [Candidatus Parcubacteria bacterium]|jgi:hypothetical protein
MSFFKFGSKTDRYGVLIDVGSGSVLTAIVFSAANQKLPQIVWSHREHAPLRNIDSMEQSAKAVMTALVNATMQLDSTGRKVLYDFDHNAKLSEVQCTISAPWSYTVTKNINYNQEKPYLITEELIEDLIETVQEKIKSDINENETLLHLGLSVITRGTMDVQANGYRVPFPAGNKAKTLTIARSSVIAQQYLIDVVDEMRDKLFQSAKVSKLSFMLVMYEMTRKFFGRGQDTCLIDVTYEATEIGVIRDGVLTYCTHAPFGAFSLAREISGIVGVTLHEAFGYLHTETPYTFIETLTKSQKEDVEAVFESYVEKLTQLFHETGDSLSIPKQISLNTDLKSEPLFIDLIEKAVKRTIKTEPKIILVSEEIIKILKEDESRKGKSSLPFDSALLLAAQFFHTKDEQHSFEYL